MKHLAFAILCAASTTAALISPAPAHAAPLQVYACLVRLYKPATNEVAFHFVGYNQPACQGNKVGDYHRSNTFAGRDYLFAEFAQLVTAAREGTPVQVEANAAGELSTLIFRAAP